MIETENENAILEGREDKIDLNDFASFAADYDVEPADKCDDCGNWMSPECLDCKEYSNFKGKEWLKQNRI